VIESGRVVTVFQDRHYFFLAIKGKEDVFCHFKNGKLLQLEGNQIDWSSTPLDHVPTVNERIYFRRNKAKPTSAYWWTTEKEYNRVQQAREGESLEPRSNARSRRR
jgi:hypothetical protein